MPRINGAASGIDIDGLVNASLVFRRAAIERLEAKRALLTAQQGLVLGLRTRLSSFRGAAEGLTSLSSALMAATSTADDNVTATAAATAQPGVHDLVVHGLAQAHRLGSQGFADTSTTAIAASAGKFEVRVGDGATLSVDVTATTTLDELKDAINTANGSVTASIVNDGSTTNPHRLVLTSNTTGSSQVIQVTRNDTTTDFATNSFEQPTAYASNSSDYTGAATTSGSYTGTNSKSFLVEVLTEGAVGTATYRVSVDGGNTWDDNSGAGYTTSTVAASLGTATTGQGVEIAFSAGGTLRAGDKFHLDAFAPTLREAQDAFVEIDGVGTFSSTNSISSAISGVTLALEKADPAKTVSINVTRTTGSIETALGEFVDAYNDLVGGIRQDQTFDETTNTAGSLLGDPVANRIVYELAGALNQDIPSVTGTFRNLVDVGLTVDRDGVLSLDSARLSSALATDPDSVLEVLEGVSSVTNDEVTVLETPTTVEAGSYQVAVTQAAAKGAVVASGALSTLTASETLNFTHTTDATEVAPVIKTFQVTLASGRTPTQVVADLNDAFNAQSAALTASLSGGVLRIETNAYGADEKVDVFSDRTGVGSTQIGTTTLSGTGVDIAGSIAGLAASGTGDELSISGGNFDGFRLRYSGTTTGTVATISVVRGASSIFSALAKNLGEVADSPVSARDAALTAELEDIEQRIIERQRLLALTERRVRAQFVALDGTLGRLQSQGTALLQALGVTGSGTPPT